MKGVTRRRVLQHAVGASAAIALPWGRQSANASPSLRKYVQPVPLPGAGIVGLDGTGGGPIAFTQTQIERKLHPDLPPTPIWAYDPGGSGIPNEAGSFNVAVVAKVGTALTLTFTNNLPGTYPSWLPVDRRLTLHNDDVVRAMTHLHGGFVAADSDGNP
jgi:spore coat protein A, manganese oxidase